MIYAGDQWVQLPVKDLYDSQMMAMAINAAKDMYDKGLQLLKDFLKEYGDFMTPFANDMETYGNMVNGVRNIINSASEQGIDLFKSPEGRSLISRAINSIDPGVYNQMRANAKMGYAYQDAMQKLASLGKFDPTMNAAWLKSQGVGPFELFSTVGDNGLNSWTVSSPIEAATLQQLTDSLYKGRTPHELTVEQAKRALKGGYDPRKIYTGYTEEDLLKTAGEGVPGLTGDWRLDYFRDLARQKVKQTYPNATADLIEELAQKQFQYDVAEANRRYLVDPVGSMNDYFKEQELALDRQKLAQSAAIANRNYQLEQAKLKVDLMKHGIYETPDGKFVSLQDSGIVQPVEARQIDKNVNARNDALSNYQAYFIAAMKLNLEVIDRYNKEKTASEVGYKEEKVTSPQRIYTSNGANVPVTVGGVYTKKTPYIKNAHSDSELRKMMYEAKTAEYNNALYKQILKGGPQELIKRGFLDEEGYPTKKYTQLIAKTYLNKKEVKTLPKEEVMNRVNGLYNSLYSAGDLAQGEYKDYVASQFGGTTSGKLPGYEGNHRITNTARFHYTPTHRAKLFGVRMFDGNSIQTKFDNWLATNKQAWVLDDNNINDAFVGTRGGERYEQSGSILIKKNDLLEFSDKYDMDIEEVANELGLTHHVIKNEIGNAIEHEYYEVPVTTGYTNAGGFNYSRTNLAVNKKQYGGSKNYDETLNAQRQSIMN